MCFDGPREHIEAKVALAVDLHDPSGLRVCTTIADDRVSPDCNDEAGDVTKIESDTDTRDKATASWNALVRP